MKLVSLLAVAAVALSACSYVPSARYDFAPQFVVTNLDPARLAGKWYEVASFPPQMVANCPASTAEYTPQPDGSFAVLNRCEGMTEVGVGTLRQVEGGALRVNMKGRLLPGTVWVLDMSPDGRMVMLGEVGRMAGWVLSRDTHLTPEQFRHAQAVFERSGYDINSLQKSRRTP